MGSSHPYRIGAILRTILPSKLREKPRTIDAFILRWVSRKYKRFRGHTLAAWERLRSLRRRNPTLSPTGPWDRRLDDGSRMNREVHVRFWESAGLRCPAPLTYLRAYASVGEARASIGRYLASTTINGRIRALAHEHRTKPTSTAYHWDVAA
jgi:hypothetical protein